MTNREYFTDFAVFSITLNPLRNYEIAREVGYHATQLSRFMWRIDKVNTSDPRLARLAAILKIPLNEKDRS